MSVLSPSLPLSLICPDWPAPENVRAVITTREGGSSPAPFDSNNLALHVGDDPQTVQLNRNHLCEQVGLSLEPQWLEQVHGVKVVDAQADGLVRTADGCISRQSGLACVVMTADCLPILLCDRAGTQVAAVHAGWRSLAGGIVREALSQFTCAMSDVLVYLGPAISQPHFEVGIDVLEGFFETALSPEHCESISAAFLPSLAKPMKFHADLYQLARAELSEIGVERVFGGSFCTFDDDQRFYSYRREARTGRMASAIWLL
ncbi:peptidoglycan editing factor PgeF [Pseudomaricurvus sp.]|uniref:peptidoglycan editing factor PgeF n=1 Tax=Pseudomaricurvus sp. TaxID=2004510 RepID=UPI003F6C1A67